ncbi:MAG: DUF3108 domain-containing protein [Prolixibacteraceae bacterium]|nr:DUF3108 domain-containing protein [Prolixibacteraceae bacterium]
MKLCTNILIILLISTLLVNAQPFVNPSIKPNTAFKAGEKLTYQIRYGIIVGGITTLSLTNDIYEDKAVFHAVATGKTTGMAEVIYGVNDVYQSWFDKETNLSYKQIRDIKEGNYTKYNEVTYNRKNNTVNSKLSGVHKVPEKILDLATSLYYIRRIDFSKVKENEVIFVNIYFSDEIFPFYLRYKGKETIRTKFGKIKCLRISPVVEVGRMFKTPNDVSIWVTDDGNYVPVMIEMDIRIVGKIHLKLIDYENLVNPMMIE